MPDLEKFINNPEAHGSPQNENGLYRHTHKLHSLLRDIATDAHDGCDMYCDCCEPCRAATRLDLLLDEVQVVH